MSSWSYEVHQRMRKWWLRCQWKESLHNNYLSKSMSQWSNESPMNSWIIEPMMQRSAGSTNQPTSEQINRWITKSMIQWSNESVSQWTHEWTNESMNPWTNEPVNPWIREAMSQWMKGFVDDRVDGQATLLCWATSSLSDLFAEAPLQLLLLCHLSGPLLLWAASQLALL